MCLASVGSAFANHCLRLLRPPNAASIEPNRRRIHPKVSMTHRNRSESLVVDYLHHSTLYSEPHPLVGGAESMSARLIRNQVLE